MEEHDMHYTLEMRGRYIQGPGAIHEIGRFTAGLGDKALLMGGPTALSLTQVAISDSLKEHNVDTVVNRFRGTHNDDEIERLAKIADESGANVVIGIGGGQALDTSKGISHSRGLPLVQVPTVASTDAPCAGGPLLVIADTEIIVKSPPRYTVAGMGDALSTPFEAEACIKSSAPNFREGRATELAYAAAKLCYDIVMEHGIEAKRCNEEGRLSEAFEKIVEANTLLSGVGYENCGLSIAHGLWNGFKLVDGFRESGTLHGEAVAWFTLVQLVLEGRSDEFINDMLAFYNAVDLPVALDDSRLVNVSRDMIDAGVEFTMEPGSSIYYTPLSLDANTVHDAIRQTDAIGRASRNS